MKLYTIGYEGMRIDAFAASLAEHGVETIVDVRQLPLSRKPGFSKSALAAKLSQHDLEYVHRPELGCPKPIRDQYRQNEDWRQYTESFVNYIATKDEALTNLAGLALRTTCALLCYEADYNFCHRSMVADAVARRAKLTVSHITLGAVSTARTAQLGHVPAHTRATRKLGAPYDSSEIQHNLAA